MKDSVKIGNTTFNPSAIEQMGFKAFKSTYGDKLNVDVAWKLITGKKPPSKVGTIRKTEGSIGEGSED